ncbi:MAG: aminoglycoside phosphotransferase family protein [Acuticoccus sp.]
MTTECGANAAIATTHREAILAVRPDLGDVPMVVHDDGWDCLAVEAGASLFKFPLHPAAEWRLRREPRALALIGPRVRLAVPQMRLHERPVLMSEHTLIAGEAVDPARYARLDASERERLAHDLAAFYAEIHAIVPEAVAAADCDALRPFPPGVVLLDTLRGRIAPALYAEAEAIATAHDAAGPDMAVFGHFDTHGWNMAYDGAAGRLRGLFDFAGCGVGPLHRDLSYTMFVAPDLTRRIVAGYRTLTGRPVDLGRVFGAHGFLRVIELCAALDEGKALAQFVAALEAFVTSAAAGHAGDA